MLGRLIEPEKQSLQNVSMSSGVCVRFTEIVIALLLLRDNA